MIHAYIRGRLGNQLFQYAFIRLLQHYNPGVKAIYHFDEVYSAGTKEQDFINALGLSLVLLSFCRYLEQRSFHFQKLLLYFGVNSIIVLCTNNLLIEVIRLLDYKIWGIFSSDFIPSIFFFLVIFTLEIPIIKIFEGKFKHKPNSDNVSKKNNKFTRIFKSQI